MLLAGTDLLKHRGNPHHDKRCFILEAQLHRFWQRVEELASETPEFKHPKLFIYQYGCRDAYRSSGIQRTRRRYQARGEVVVDEETRGQNMKRTGTPGILSPRKQQKRRHSSDVGMSKSGSSPRGVRHGMRGLQLQGSPSLGSTLLSYGAQAYSGSQYQAAQQQPYYSTQPAP